MQYQRLILPLALLALSACATLSEAEEPIAAAPEISREAAVAQARSDAQARYNFITDRVTAMRNGRVWVVDLRTADGALAHYAIAGDGSIRERSFTP
jgi:hypothetical protein